MHASAHSARWPGVVGWRLAAGDADLPTCNPCATSPSQASLRHAYLASLTGPREKMRPRSHDVFHKTCIPTCTTGADAERPSLPPELGLWFGGFFFAPAEDASHPPIRESGCIHPWTDDTADLPGCPLAG